MGQVLLISLPWDDPITLQRAWCIFEVYSCIAKDAKFDIAMTKQEEERFLANIQVNHCIAFYDMLGRIKSENSECFLENDRVEIFGAINKILPNGFITLDSILFRTIEKWIENVIKKQISNAITKGDVDSESTWNNILGTLYCQQGYYDDAERHFIRATATGSNDKQIALRAISGFASLLELQGKYEEACELYQKCLKDSNDLYGPDDPLTLTCLNDLADIYRRLELDEEAEYLYLDCISRRTSLLGEDSFETITSKNNLAGLYKDNLRYSEAIQLYSECLTASKESPDHPLVTTIVSNISVIYQLLEDYD
jgi:tetratricopeptide (TPR) repeat protein